MSASFQRRILHHGPDPQGIPVLLTDRTVTGCWFELLRQGGCGSAELELADRFDAPHDVLPGDWISCEYTPGVRWYLGRVEEIETSIPAGRRLRLEGMSIELNEIFPGGFGESADGTKPHRYGVTDLFPYDPDRSLETADSVDSPDLLLRLLLNQYVDGKSHIQINSAMIDSVNTAGSLVSAKFRGEESIRSIIKDLAVRAGGASWGVDSQQNFFFLLPRATAVSVFQIGRDITTLRQQTTREQLFNRLLLTGDYVYDRRDYSGTVARRSYRWRANFVQPESRSQYGERRIRLWLPWIRTQQDARAIAREFFRTYATSQSTYFVETVPQDSLPFPWLGMILLLNQNGDEIARGQVETIRVNFDHAPSFRMELGPADPRQLWPEPPYDERWELPDEHTKRGGDVTLTQQSSGGGGGGNSLSSQVPSTSPVSSQVILSSIGSLDSSAGTSMNSSPGSALSFSSSLWAGSSQISQMNSATSLVNWSETSAGESGTLPGNSSFSMSGGLTSASISSGAQNSSSAATPASVDSQFISSQMTNSPGTDFSTNSPGLTSLNSSSFSPLSSYSNSFTSGQTTGPYSSQNPGPGTTFSTTGSPITGAESGSPPATSSMSVSS